MKLYRWCCDMCFLHIWGPFEVVLSSCPRCLDADFRFVRADHFDSVCLCHNPEPPTFEVQGQLSWVPEYRLPMDIARALVETAPEGDVKAGSGAKRPNHRGETYAESEADTLGAASKAKRTRKTKQSQTGNETVAQLCLRFPSSDRPRKKKVTNVVTFPSGGKRLETARKRGGGTNSRKECQI